MDHKIYMQRCLDLAKIGTHDAMPNPSVGAVLVHNGRIIGEGFTAPYGGPHGEVNCINSVKGEDRYLIPDSTLYVSLEPCSHYGKTPPCCDLIIQQQIKNIVVGTVDPHVKVAGNGIKKLQEAGRNVITGVLEQECRESNRRFFTFHEKQRPYVILKWAESADGYLSPIIRSLDSSIVSLENSTLRQAQDDLDIQLKQPVWITNQYSRQLVHKWRSEEAAILAGTQTVLDDNPSLDVRDWTGKNPVRIVLDRQGRIPDGYNVKNNIIKTIVLTEKDNFANLENLEFVTIAFDGSLAKNVLEVLYRYNLLSVIIEGGAKTLQTFIDAGLWDEARVFKGPVTFEGGTAAPKLNGNLTAKENILNDELLIFRNYDRYHNI
jgi:diaminohydroxyphosphoribosylaminopyrimidine deaminase/5-amino-6-(5-phosphoribosylamino)uracil reductase